MLYQLLLYGKVKHLSIYVYPLFSGISSHLGPSNPTPWHTYLQKTITIKDTCAPVFTTALFTIARAWEQLKCPLTVEWIKKMCCIYAVKLLFKKDYSVSQLCLIKMAQSSPVCALHILLYPLLWQAEEMAFIDSRHGPWAFGWQILPDLQTSGKVILNYWFFN